MVLRRQVPFKTANEVISSTEEQLIYKEIRVDFQLLRTTARKKTCWNRVIL